MDFQERIAIRNRRANLTVYIPSGLIEVIDRFADMKVWTTGPAVEHLIRQGLKAEALKPEYQKAKE